jgi:hypothetical protein
VRFLGDPGVLEKQSLLLVIPDLTVHSAFYEFLRFGAN